MNIKSRSENNSGFNEIIAVILIIAMVVAISSVIWLFTSATTSEDRTLIPVVFEARYDSDLKTLTIRHKSGETIIGALYRENGDFIWGDLVLKKNNTIITKDMMDSFDVTNDNINLSPNEVITVVFKESLNSGDKISIIYVPYNQLIKSFYI